MYANAVVFYVSFRIQRVLIFSLFVPRWSESSLHWIMAIWTGRFHWLLHPSDCYLRKVRSVIFYGSSMSM